MQRPGIQSLSPDVACARLAATQFGLITLEQALDCGLSKSAIYRRLQTGRFIRIYPGVFIVEGAVRSWKQKLMAAALWAGDAAISHCSAAALWRFPDFRPGPVELSTATNRKSGHGVTIHRVAELPRHEVALLGPLRVTTPTRTLLDLCGQVDTERFEIAFHYALHHKMANMPRLRLNQSRVLHGAAILREVLSAYDDCPNPPASPLEVKILRLLRRLDLPPAQLVPVDTPHGRRTIDFAWPHALVGIEWMAIAGIPVASIGTATAANFPPSRNSAGRSSIRPRRT